MKERSRESGEERSRERERRGENEKALEIRDIIGFIGSGL